ncbi:hypothetical protein MGYG_01728 [Nannizzia gypsea CBS 118893]|uniref:Uncharacterized protein n=1 Tax=Arthroderma gypseum (strain ATCC MYA-4604 / CBS 118893) TaxID=535722 RepID=E5R306_ARTGP|nr:hypothetical protein MGYG_01728 [Nannizzia gypsea CBS 118893]EFQ98710.1 hypothetical protein MGYG_01728 [Nannizzia gypsea CBS 118893]
MAIVGLDEYHGKNGLPGHHMLGIHYLDIGAVIMTRYLADFICLRFVMCGPFTPFAALQPESLAKHVRPALWFLQFHRPESTGVAIYSCNLCAESQPHQQTCLFSLAQISGIILDKTSNDLKLCSE